MSELPPAIQWAQAQLSQYGRVGCTKVLKVPDLAAAVPVAVGLTSVSVAPLLQFRDPGTVIALYAQERAGTVAKFAQTDLRVQMINDEDLITNGSAGDFAPLLGLVGPSCNWFPLTRRVTRNENWTISYRNMDPAAVANPSCLFAFIADADIGRLEQQYREAVQRGGR